MDNDFTLAKTDVSVPCSVCGDAIGYVKKTFRIGYDIDGLKYCRLCGDALRYSRSVRSHK